MIRVLVVDDSAIVRKVLSEELSKHDDIEVVGTAIDPYAARDKIIALKPDVITLDVEMPRMDGLSFLERLMRFHPLPVIIVSSLTPTHSEAAVRALALGAVDIVCKPGAAYSVPDVARDLVRAVRAAARAKIFARPIVQSSGVVSRAAVARSGSANTASAAPLLAGLRTSHRILAIGASTGGTRALEELLLRFPPTAPATVIVQHMPPGFTLSFAQRLDGICSVSVREAKDGDLLAPGLVLIAPGGHHLVLQRSGAQLVARIKDGPPVHHQRPAVDVLFQSVARTAGRNAVGAVLTGMGADGATGLLAMRHAGAWTIAQDEATSVVFGMPREAIAVGGACEVLPLPNIADALIDAAINVDTQRVGTVTPVGETVTS